MNAPDRTWKHNGVTHVVRLHQRQWRIGPGIMGRTHPLPITLCGIDLPDLPWRNTSRMQRSKIDCMACIAALDAP